MDTDKILANIEAASQTAFGNILNTFESMQITTTTDIKSHRLSICQGCDKYEITSNRCKECGCFMQIKAAIKHSRCPLNHW